MKQTKAQPEADETVDFVIDDEFLLGKLPGYRQIDANTWESVDGAWRHTFPIGVRHSILRFKRIRVAP